MSTLQATVEKFLQELISNDLVYVENNEIKVKGNLGVGPIVHEDASITPTLEYDSNGFGVIETKEGGRKIAGYEDLKLQYRASRNPNKRKAAQAAPEFVVINKDLSAEQAKLFIHNNTKYFFIHETIQKIFENNEMGAFIVFELKANGSNTSVPNHLVAVAGNWSIPGTPGYSKYLELVTNSCKRWLHNEYKKLESASYENKNGRR